MIYFSYNNKMRFVRRQVNIHENSDALVVYGFDDTKPDTLTYGLALDEKNEDFNESKLASDEVLIPKYMSGYLVDAVKHLELISVIKKIPKQLKGRRQIGELSQVCDVYQVFIHASVMNSELNDIDCELAEIKKQVPLAKKRYYDLVETENRLILLWDKVHNTKNVQEEQDIRATVSTMESAEEDVRSSE